MANELAVRYTANDGAEIALDPQSISRYIVAGQSGAQASEKDVARFVAICQARKLNPLAGDCYLTVYNSKMGPQASVIVSKDYFQDQANNNPEYDGCECGIIVFSNGRLDYRKGTFYMKGEDVVGGWAEVRVKSRSLPERVEVSMEEYNSGKSLWLSKPGTMIAKVARVQALRAAFPRSFAGVYDAAEIDTTDRAATGPAPIRSHRPEPVQVEAEVQPEPPKRPRLSEEQAAELNDLCVEASQVCGQPVDVLKKAVWHAAPYGGEDWGEYMSKAREAAMAFVETHMPEAEPDYSDVPYEY